VTASGTVGTCGIRFADDMGQNGNIEVEVAGGTLVVNPAALFFATNTSPPQIVNALDPGADTFTCTSSDPTDVTATITSNSGSATCSIGPTSNGFVGTAQVTFGDSLGSTAIVQVGVGTQPLSKHHRVTPGGVKRPLPNPRGSPSPVVPVRPLPNPNGPSFELSAQQVTLAAQTGRQTIQANVFDYRGALSVSNSAPQVVDVVVMLGNGPIRFIAIIAKAPGTAIVRIADDRGNVRYVHVVVVPAVNRPVHNPKPGGPP
jgi:hypothetical protein